MNKTSFGAYALITLSSILAYVGIIFLRGIALLWLWTWFVVPLGVTPIAFWHALGIGSLIAFVTYELNTPQEEDTDWLKLLLTGFIKSAMFSVMALFFGFIYQLFM